jgi:hypothetical protein
LEAFFLEDFFVAFLAAFFVAFFTDFALGADLAGPAVFLLAVFALLTLEAFEALDAFAALDALVADFLPDALATFADFFLSDFVSLEVFFAAD